jgi:RNA recognition motif-containing protein
MDIGNNTQYNIMENNTQGMVELFIHITGIDGNMSKEERVSFLQEMFEGLYEISEDKIQLIVNRDFGGFKQFMFAKIDTQENADKIIAALNETEFQGHQIVVNIAQPREDRPRTGGFGGGNRGGNSRGGFGGGSRGGFSGGNSRGGSNGGYQSSRGYREE